MFVCICNALREKDLRSTIESQSIRNVSEAYRSMGCSPKCGKCARDVANLIGDDANENHETAIAAE